MDTMSQKEGDKPINTKKTPNIAMVVEIKYRGVIMSPSGNPRIKPAP
ncbi:hypothetical protein XNC3_1070017 [Xenorhabdus nematophila F1]|nr:hypothetical protein [Xenorhabdus nematophila]CCW28993.1 hypothetical protein XNC3_1070017 [Xenorhabdus nematophila F1]CEF29461.1 hypothetical protein XNW1_1790008 [Xenorhabdus nematophila str. Websteri]